MERSAADRSTAGITLAGLVALASAMGIGRFAFTPMLPLMQDAAAVGLREGGWLASANYAGYFVGALALTMFPARAAASVRIGLVAVAATTLAMALSDRLAIWLVLRFAAGVASACVLVGVLAWALPALATRGRTSLTGVVFAGVGVGMALAGFVGLWAGVIRVAPPIAWLALGTVATLACIVVWPALRADATVRTTPGSRAAGLPASAGTRLLVLCYGAFGLGYIIPATFVPALARDALADASLFGWAWPVFGATAALSTIAVSRMRVPPIRLWIVGHVVMALGVVAPLISLSGVTVFVSAACVGSTFMVVTMAGLRIGRDAGGPRLVSAMTAAFAFGQLVGPLALREAASGRDAIVGPSFVAAALLVLSAIALRSCGAVRNAVLNDERITR